MHLQAVQPYVGSLHGHLKARQKGHTDAQNFVKNVSLLRNRPFRATNDFSPDPISAAIINENDFPGNVQQTQNFLQVCTKSRHISLFVISRNNNRELRVTFRKDICIGIVRLLFHGAYQTLLLPFFENGKAQAFRRRDPVQCKAKRNQC